MQFHGLAAVVLAAFLVTPLAAEEPPALTADESRVYLAASIQRYRDTCGQIIAPASRAMLRAAEKAERVFVEANGQPAWDAAFAELRAEFDVSRHLDAPHLVCAYLHEGYVLYDQIDTGVKGPSFRCAGEKDPARVRICKGGPVAWGFDRAAVQLGADLATRLNEKGKALLDEWRAESQEDLARCDDRPDCARNVLSYEVRRLSELWVKVQARLGTPP